MRLSRPLFEKTPGEPDIPKTNRGQESNRARNLEKLNSIINEATLSKKGWTKKSIKELKRYVYLRFNFSNMSRRYTNALKYLKDKRYKAIVDKVEKYMGSTVELDETMLINILEKSRPNKPSAVQLADKLKAQFGEVLEKYNIDLDKIVKKLEKDMPPTVYKQWDIDRKKQEGVSDWISKIANTIQGAWESVKQFFSSLFASRDQANDVIKKINEAS